MSSDSSDNSQQSAAPVLPPKSPNPSAAAQNATKKMSSMEEEIEKWRTLMENHHEQCDLTKCMGKRANGLFICQFSNIPGSQYSQYLRHRRRIGAYKTKPCRNFYGTGFCQAGRDCSFYHNDTEKRAPPPESDTLMGENAVVQGNGPMNFPIGHFHAQTKQSKCLADESLRKELEGLNKQVRNTYERLLKQYQMTNEFLRLRDNNIATTPVPTNVVDLFHGSKQLPQINIPPSAQTMHQQFQAGWHQQQLRDPAAIAAELCGTGPMNMNAANMNMNNNFNKKRSAPNTPTFFSAQNHHGFEDDNVAKAAAAAAFRNAICGGGQQQQHTNYIDRQVQFGIGGGMGRHQQKMGLGRWYSVGMRSEEDHHNQSKTAGVATAHTNSWEDCSASNTTASRSISPLPPTPFNRAQFFDFNVQPQIHHYSRAALGPIGHEHGHGNGNGNGNVGMVDEPKDQHNQSLTVFDFSKSFHPFSESYPLKDLPTSAASTTSTESTEAAGSEPLTPLAKNQPDLLGGPGLQQPKED